MLFLRRNILTCSGLVLLLCLAASLLLLQVDFNNSPRSLRHLVSTVRQASTPSKAPEDTVSGIETIEEQARQEELALQRQQEQRQKQQQTSSSAQDDSIQFVFVIGLEGSGHHILRAVFPESPAFQRKEAMGLGQVTHDLRRLVYPHGIWEGVCTDLAQEADGQTAFDNLVQAFQTTHQQARDANAENEPLMIALNACEGGTMQSYPNLAGDCRPFHYPDMDALYAACDAAGVQCGHIYLYRDPYEVIHSAQRRNFNPSVIDGIKLYYSMLGVILSQLHGHPERTLACWNLLDNEQSPPSEREDRMRDLFGWKDQDAFQQKINEVIRPHTPLSQPEREALVPSNLHVNMHSMMSAHNRVVDLCRAQVRENGYVV